MDKFLPKDVDKWKLFFTALFLGFFGTHYAKVGRYKMFTYGVVSAASIYIAVFLPQSWFNHQYLFLLMWALILPASVYAIIWIVSIFSILTNKFKVPISIDEELVTESLDKELVEDILKVAKTSEDANIKQNAVVEKSTIKDEKSKQIKTVKQDQVTDNSKQKNKFKKIVVKCASCGQTVKVFESEKICPKCDEPLKED